MPKRKSGLSSQHSQKSRRIDPSSMVKSSQLTRASLRHRKPSEEPITATVVDVENDNARTPVSPLILDSQANEVTQGLKLPQGCTLDVGAFWDVSAEPFPPVDVKYSPEVTDLYEASAQPTTLPCSHVRDPKPSGGIPQMTYERYQALLRSLGHVEGIPGPPKNMPTPPNLVGNNLGPRSDRKTDFRPDQAEYSPDNLPEIIYAFEQPVNYYGLSKLKEPPPKSYTIHGEQVRDIPILPDRISPDPEGWLYEYWSRMDPRIRYDKDIAPRIRPDLRPLYPTRFSMSRRRFRVDCYILGWVVKGKIFEKSRNEILSAGLKAGIDVEGTNSTRGLSWGLVDPSRGESGGRIEVPDRLRPKNTRVHGPAGVSVPPTLGGSHSGNEDAQRTHHQYQMIPAQVGPPQSPLSQSLTSEVLASSRAMISGAPRFLAEAPTIIGEPSSPSQVPQSQAINGHIDDMLQPDIAVSNDTDQKLKHWETAMLYAQNFPTHDFGQSYTSQPLNRFCGLPPRGFMDGSQQRSSSSQGRIPNVYEGYAEANEMFVQDVSGTYLPLPAMQTAPAKPNTLPCFLGPLGSKPYGARANDHSFQNFQMSRESSIHPRAATEHLDGAERTVQTLRQSAFSKKQHREYSFYQKDEILHHAAKHAIKHNLNKPSEEETVAMNMVVEGFYARDNVPLLYTVDHEWESTRLDFAEFYDRVKFNPVHFHEYFPLLVRDIKEYTRQTLGKPLAGSRTTSWPDSRVPAEQVLYNTVWNFERRRWNQYTKSSSSAEPF